MKRKTILGLLALVAALFTLDTVKAATEATPNVCIAPWNNVCYRIYKDKKLISTKNGTLNIN